MKQLLQIWEEKDLIEQLRKFVNKPIFDPNVGINETKNVFAKNGCEDIGNKKKWIRRCPECNKPRYYSTERSMVRAKQEKRKCPSCNATNNNRTKLNHIGDRFGKLVVTNQYYQKTGNLKVDYVCDRGNKVFTKSYSKIRIQKMCSNCRKTNSHRIGIDTAFKTLFSDYKRNAKTRHFEFSISENDFKSLTQQACFYCGNAPTYVKHAKRGNYIYNGVDRRNNDIGYTMENCVPCCKKCNYAKHTLTTEEFF